MTSTTTILVLLLVCVILLVLLIKGVIKTFQRQPVVAILMIIFLFPIYLCWAAVEAFFTGPINGN